MPTAAVLLSTLSSSRLFALSPMRQSYIGLKGALGGKVNALTFAAIWAPSYIVPCHRLLGLTDSPRLTGSWEGARGANVDNELVHCLDND